MALRSLLAALLIAGIACAGQGGGGIGIAGSTSLTLLAPAERRIAPPVEGEVLAGEAFSPGDLAGAVVVLNFWGSWCGPCRREQPLLEASWKRFSSDGVRFIGINTRRDQRAAALAFLEEFGVTYPSLYDPSSLLAFDFGVRVMPATIVLDRQGRIAAEVVGAFRSRAELNGLIRQVLAA